MRAENPQNSPYAVEVEAGESYYWCSCGKSKTQPFCDGSHQGTSFTPVEYKATENKTKQLISAGVKNQPNNQCVTVVTASSN